MGSAPDRGPRIDPHPRGSAARSEQIFSPDGVEDVLQGFGHVAFVAHFEPRVASVVLDLKASEF